MIELKKNHQPNTSTILHHITAHVCVKTALPCYMSVAYSGILFIIILVIGRRDHYSSYKIECSLIIEKCRRDYMGLLDLTIEGLGVAVVSYHLF